MLGLFGSLNMASRSLAAQQEATAVAGQNMANINTAGYARERVVLQTSTPLETASGEEGTGADAVSITEVRNALLDNQIQSENSVTGSYTAQQSSLTNAEAWLGEQITNTSGASAASTTGLAQDLSNLFNSFQSLSTNPGDTATRETVIQSAQDVAAQFNTVSSNLSQARGNINSSIQSDVASSNQDMSDIASLNQQIVLAQAGGQTANELVDARQQKIEDLSSKLTISTSAQPDGAINISVGGVAMVTGSSAVNSLQTYDAGGGQILVEDQNSSTPLSITGGSIGGNITARDGALATLQTSMDTLASQLITSVNSIYSGGYDLNGNTGQDLFTGSDAATIGVNNSLASDPSQFQASGAAGANGDNTVALALAQLANQSLPALGGQTLSQSYASTVSNLGNAIATATDQLNTSQAISTTLNNQRSSESGVSIDEEMTNLMQYQKAYEASAQLVSTLNSMMSTVINMKSAA